MRLNPILAQMVADSKISNGTMHAIFDEIKMIAKKLKINLMEIDELERQKFYQ